MTMPYHLRLRHRRGQGLPSSQPTAQHIGIEPSENFQAPSMALDAEVLDVEKSEIAGQVLGLISAVSELTPVPAHTPWRIRVSRTDPPADFMIDLSDDEMVEVTAGISDVLSDRMGFPPTLHQTDGYR